MNMTLLSAMTELFILLAATARAPSVLLLISVKLLILTALYVTVEVVSTCKDLYCAVAVQEIMPKRYFIFPCSTALPQRLLNGKCQVVWPHMYPRVNNIFEVAKQAGLRTAWADKHLSYDLARGPSGKGEQTD